MLIIKHKLKFNVQNSFDEWKNYSHTNWEQYFFDYVDDNKYLNYDFIDIGAAIGKTAIYAAHKFKRVIALEPDYDAFKKLKDMCELNKVFSNIVVLHNFLSSKYIKSRFQNNSIFSDIHFKHRTKLTSCICYGITLKKLLNTFNLKKFFLKIDIEGQEFTLIADKEFLKIIKERKPNIYLAIHFGTNHKLKYKISRIRFFQRFLNLTKTFEEYRILYNLIKNYKIMKVNKKKNIYVIFF